jgi:hypothetical protein
MWLRKAHLTCHKVHLLMNIYIFSPYYGYFKSVRSKRFFVYIFNKEVAYREYPNMCTGTIRTHFQTTRINRSLDWIRMPWNIRLWVTTSEKPFCICKLFLLTISNNCKMGHWNCSIGRRADCHSQIQFCLATGHRRRFLAHCCSLTPQIGVHWRHYLKSRSNLRVF